MRKVLVLFFICFTLVGCMRRSSYEYIHLQPYTKITSPSVYILTPSSYPKTPFKTSSLHFKETITLHRIIPDMMRGNIKISVNNLKENLIGNKLLSKDTNKDFEEYFSNLPLTKWEIKNHRETRVNYYKDYVDFVSKLKCHTSVSSQNIANGIGSKSYWTFCPYYDKQGMAKYIGIDYRFYFTFNRTKFEGADNPSLVKHKFEEIELQFKKDMKEIFDSLEIYDMDRAKMKEEGLLYNHKYDLDNESNAKDKSLKCTFNYENRTWKCVGK